MMFGVMAIFSVAVGIVFYLIVKESFFICVGAAFVLSFFLIFVPSVAIDLWFSEERLTEPYVSSSIDISAMKDGSKTEGTAFLGSGMIESAPHYIYIEETPQGKRMGSVEATRNTYVIEDNAEEPRIDFVKQREEYASDLAATWFGPLPDVGVTKVFIYVPEDSVVTEYEVDLQ